MCCNLEITCLYFVVVGAASNNLLAVALYSYVVSLLVILIVSHG